jgi:hypothetical protein
MAQITKRTKADGKVSWRVRVQGYPERSKTFPTKTAAKEWAATIEADLARGVEMVSKEARTKTVNRYAAALSHCFKIAAKVWLWLNRSPMENVGRYSEGEGTGCTEAGTA